MTTPRGAARPVPITSGGKRQMRLALRQEAEVDPEKDKMAPAPHKLDVRIRWGLGIIAVVATLIASGVAATTAIYSANKAAETQEAVAQANFQRNQRQVAYQDFWNDFLLLRGSLRNEISKA